MNRLHTIAALASSLALAACGGGGGVASASGSATGSDSTGATGGSSGSGTGTGTGTGTTTPTDPNQANMFAVSTTTSFDVIGGLQSFSIDSNNATLYQGDASTVAQPSGTISYSPRDGIFTLTLADTAAGVSRNITFQDPDHRATADSARNGNYQVPLLTGFNYLQALDGTANLTFFYKRPVTGTFVTIGGFERTETTDDNTTTSEQGAFAFGSKAPLAAVPTSGSGHFTGDFLASMVGQRAGTPLVLQWINGTSTVDADFKNRTLTLGISGTVGPGYIKNTLVPDSQVYIASGTSFSAQGSTSWTKDNVAFSGKFSAASFAGGGIPVDLTPVSAGTSSGGASSIDGTFYGPNATNVGGNLRITGGTPNQRVDILGAFTGIKH